MYMFITICREASPLNREEWTFWYFDREHTLRCRSYQKLSRPSTRHKFRKVENYDSHMSRHCTLATPPLPDDVAAEAKQKFLENLTVSVWKAQ